MALKRINLEEQPNPNKRLSPRRLKKIYLALTVVATLFIGSVLFSLFRSSWGVIKPFIPGLKEPLKSTDGRVNVLLMGIGGAGHDGPLLTDSIIVASYDLNTKSAVMFSIPRDLWLDNIKQKVNAAYAIGSAKGDGLSFAEDKIDDVLGIKIHYGVVIDFSGFSKAIDLVGGVDVNVPHSFDDYEYPLEGKENDLCGYTEKEIDIDDNLSKQLNVPVGKQKFFISPDGQIATDSSKIGFSCRFEHLHFDGGQTHLDGALALKFVRSRHGDNGEGSDFARSRRQQLVIQAFRQKALSIPTLANPQKLIDLTNTFKQSIVTDVPPEHYLDFYSLVKNETQVESVVLGDLGDGTSLFINPDPASYGGAWVLIPKQGYSKIADFVHQKIVPSTAASPQK